MSKIKLNKVEVKVINKVEKKIDKRKSNPGRPINKKSARYIRLQQQSWYEDNSTYKYSAGKNNTLGCIIDGIGSHECNVSYIGRTKVQGYKFVLGKKVNVELNLKTLKFVK